MTTAIRALIIEDDTDEAELLCLQLEDEGFEVEWVLVDNEADLREALEARWDIIISDYDMPGFDGARAFEVLVELGVEVPFIMVARALAAERAEQVLQAGVRDYVRKDNLARLGSAVRRQLAAGSSSHS